MITDEQHFELWEILQFSLLLASPLLVISFISQLFCFKKLHNFSVGRVLIAFVTQVIAYAFSQIIWFYWPFEFDIMQGPFFLPLLFIEIPLLLVTYFYSKTS